MVELRKTMSHLSGELRTLRKQQNILNGVEDPVARTDPRKSNQIATLQMTYEEKQQLSTAIAGLTEDKLKTLLDIIEERTNVPQTGKDIQIDLDNLDNGLYVFQNFT